MFDLDSIKNGEALTEEQFNDLFAKIGNSSDFSSGRL